MCIKYNILYSKVSFQTKTNKQFLQKRTFGVQNKTRFLRHHPAPVSIAHLEVFVHISCSKYATKNLTEGMILMVNNPLLNKEKFISEHKFNLKLFV